MDGTKSLVLNGQLMIYDVIDPDYGIRALDVIASLAQNPGQNPITVRLNSPGGSVTEGFAIYNALKATGSRIIIHVDALAASIASLIAMAGDEIVMAENASIMIHDPWAVAIGSGEDLRAQADEIDRLKAIMITTYAKRTGMAEEEISALMSAETFMGAAEAVEKGFATRVDQPLAIAACATIDPQKLARLLAKPSTLQAAKPDHAAAAAQPKGTPMGTKTEGGVENRAEDNKVNEAAIREEAAKAERTRVQGIHAAVRAAKLPQDFADKAIAEGKSIDGVRAEIIDAWAAAQAEKAGPETEKTRTEVKADSSDRFVQGATLGLMARVGMAGGERNEFTGLTMAELARESLHVRGVKASGSRLDMVGQAFTAVRAAVPGMHSTSDFGSILANVAQKAMMKGYTEADETFEQWTARGSLSDFRAASRVDLGLFPALSKVEEGGEYTYGTLGDTGVSVVLATYGKMFAITRQAVINDDMDAISKIPTRMGRAAKRTIGNLVYGILTGNPTMQDGVALFHSTHANLAGSGAAPSVTTLGAARVAMIRQPDLGGLTAGVGIRPKFILLPPELEDATTVLLNSQYDPSGTAGTLKPNSARNFATPVVDTRLSGTAWYLAGDPNSVDTIEVDYLDGNDQPFMDQRDGWTVDGTEFKVRIDAGVKALHWRGLYKNPGA